MREATTKKIFDWIVENRVLDGYIGLMGIVLHYQILALYHTTVDILYLSLRAWKWTIFSVGASYHPLNKKNCRYVFYPPLTFRLRILKWSPIDTGAEAARLTSERVDRHMKAYEADKAEEKRLIAAAKLAGL